MKIIRMRKSGKRLQVTDRIAALYFRMGAAVEEPLVIKKPLSQEPQSAFESIMDSAEEVDRTTVCISEDLESESDRKVKSRRRRHYRRRDMEAE